MTSKLLPLVESPIRGYMMYSYHLAVTLAHVDVWPWFHTNFVQLQCNPDQLKLSDFLDFSSTAKGELHFTEGTLPFNPWLANSPQLDFETIDALDGDISRYVCESLDRDFYVETFVDEFYIPALFNGGTTHFRHRLLVFGHDTEQHVFKIIGFDKHSQYRHLECTHAELDAAFAGISPQIPARTRLLKPRANQLPPATFDRHRFLAVLDDYLNSTNTQLNPDLRGDLKPDSHLWYGLKTYDFLQAYLRQVVERRTTGGENVVVDFRGFHVLWEHKKCMSQRLAWLSENGFPISQDLRDRFSQVQSMVDAARSRVVICHRGLLPPGKLRIIELPAQLEAAKRIEAEVLRDVWEIIAAHDQVEIPDSP